jgi:NIMA (never in mitosis gene a)-related kinase
MDAYEVIGVVGKGSFGSVTKVRRKADGKFCVWKEISYGRMNEREKSQLVAEVNILRELRHPNIVKYYDRLLDRERAKIFIVMEYCEGGDLSKLLRKLKQDGSSLSEEMMWGIFSQVADALHECHKRERKILHRDIKPGNVFLDANLNVKLGDFGLSKILNEGSAFAYTHVGTPFYMSPEQITDEGRYNEKSDIWSLGCLLFEMAALAPPFEAKSHPELNERIRQGRMGRLPDRYSPEVRRVVQWMLSTDPNQRPSTEEVLNIPQVLVRLREKKLKDMQTGTKQKEAELKQKEEELKKLEEDLKRRETAVIERENKVAEAEKALAQKQETRPDTPQTPYEARAPVDPKPRPLGEANIRKPPPRGRNWSPSEKLAIPAYRNYSGGMKNAAGEKRSYSPKIQMDVDGIRPRTAVVPHTPTPSQVERFIQEYRSRPKTALPSRTPRYTVLHS